VAIGGARLSRRRRIERGKLLIDHHAQRRQVGQFDPKSTEKHQQPATTDSGASVEEQVRKEWNPKTDGGLPVF